MINLVRCSIFAVALLTAIGITVPATEAQSPDCWETETETTTIINPQTGQPITITTTSSEYDESCDTINDGRENDDDRAAEAAIYCTDYGVDIYDLDISGRGTFVFRATYDEIESVPQNPNQNTLIDRSGVFALYRLTSGEMQLNGPYDWEGKPYVFTWGGCERPNN